jgi:hypothetical protein
MVVINNVNCKTYFTYLILQKLQLSDNVRVFS